MLEHRNHITRNAARRLLVEMGAKFEDRGPKAPSNWAVYVPMKGDFRVFKPEGGSTTHMTLSTEERRIILSASEHRVRSGDDLYVLIVYQFRPDASEAAKQGVLDTLSASSRIHN